MTDFEKELLQKARTYLDGEYLLFIEEAKLMFLPKDESDMESADKVLNDIWDYSRVPRNYEDVEIVAKLIENGSQGTYALYDMHGNIITKLKPEDYEYDVSTLLKCKTLADIDECFKINIGDHPDLLDWLDKHRD